MATAPSYEELKAQDAELKAKALARKRAEALAQWSVTLHVGDRSWLFSAGDVTARHVGQFRRQTGSEMVDPVTYLLLTVTEESAPVDLVAQLVWFARVQAGDEDVTVDDVASGISMAEAVWVEFHSDPFDPGEEEVVFPDPPPSAASE